MSSSALIDAEFARAQLEQMRQMFDARDVEGLMALCTDDVVFDDMGSGNEIHGREEFRLLFGNLFSGMQRLTAALRESFLGLDGQSIAARWDFEVIMPDRPEPIAVQTASVYTCRDGKVAKWTIVFRNVDWLGDVWP